jgi:hypothetical protein
MSSIKTAHNSLADKIHCVICGKSGGILICNGCQLTFCSKHVVKHRQELTYQLEDIMQNHDLLREDIEQSSNGYFHLRKIDKWEKESIKKIQLAAETARVDLKEIIDKSKRRLTRISHDIVVDLNSSWKTDDFSENDLLRWKKQLNDLRLEIKSLYSIQFIEDQQYPIYPITITNNTFQNHLNINKQLKLNSQEYFFKATNPASIENDGLIVKHIGSDSHYAHILGKMLYSQGRHTIQFRIIQSAVPYTIFFGCISSEIIQSSINYKSSFAVGWFGYNEIYQHGIWNNNLNIHGYDSNEIQTDDILHLTFDCDQKQIELFHKRMNKTYKLPVNINKAPLPWQLLVVLVQKDDCVKILPKE